MKYFYGYTVGVIFEYLMRVEYNVYALIALILIIIGVILKELNEKTTIFTNKN